MDVKKKKDFSTSTTMDPRILESVKHIQPPPMAVTKLIDILAKDFHTSEVIEILQTDPALTAAVLKKCNTAFFSQRGGVTSLNQAIQLLGSSTIMSMVLELTMGANLNLGLENYGIPTSGLRKHSLFAAVAAKELTKYCGILPFTPDTAFTAGLLHDIGKIAVNEVLIAEDIDLTKRSEFSQRSNTELERGLLGTDHAEVGALVLDGWKFPEFFCNAVRQHHVPAADNQLAHLVHIANWCAHSIGLSIGYQTSFGDLTIESLSAVALTETEVKEAIIDTYTVVNKQFKNILSNQAC